MLILCNVLIVLLYGAIFGCQVFTGYFHHSNLQMQSFDIPIAAVVIIIQIFGAPFVGRTLRQEYKDLLKGAARAQDQLLETVLANKASVMGQNTVV